MNVCCPLALDCKGGSLANFRQAREDRLNRGCGKAIGDEGASRWQLARAGWLVQAVEERVNGISVAEALLNLAKFGCIDAVRDKAERERVVAADGAAGQSEIDADAIWHARKDG